MKTTEDFLKALSETEGVVSVHDKVVTFEDGQFFDLHACDQKKEEKRFPTVPSDPNDFQWTLKRPPLFRYCTLVWTSSSWPDQGRGVWELIGYENMGLKTESFQLRRVVPSQAGGSTGEIIHLWRASYENGALNVFEKLKIDAEFSVPKDIKKSINFK